MQLNMSFVHYYKQYAENVLLANQKFCYIIMQIVDQHFKGLKEGRFYYY